MTNVDDGMMSKLKSRDEVNLGTNNRWWVLSKLILGDGFISKLTLGGGVISKLTLGGGVISKLMSGNYVDS